MAILVVAPDKELNKCKDEFAAVRQLLPMKLLTASKAVDAVSSLQRAGGPIGGITAVFLHARFSAPGKEEYSETLRKFLKEKCPDVPVVAFGAGKSSCGKEGEHYQLYLGSEVEPRAVASLLRQLQASGISSGSMPQAAASRSSTSRHSLDSLPCPPVELLVDSPPWQGSPISTPARTSSAGSLRYASTELTAAAQRRSLQIECGNSSPRNNTSRRSISAAEGYQWQPISPRSPVKCASMEGNNVTQPVKTTTAAAAAAAYNSTSAVTNPRSVLASQAGFCALYGGSNNSIHAQTSARFGSLITSREATSACHGQCKQPLAAYGQGTSSGIQQGSTSTDFGITGSASGGSWFTNLATLNGLRAAEQQEATNTGVLTCSSSGSKGAPFQPLTSVPAPVTRAPRPPLEAVNVAAAAAAAAAAARGGSLSAFGMTAPTTGIVTAGCAAAAGAGATSSPGIGSTTGNESELFRLLSAEVLHLRQALLDKRTREADAVAAAAVPAGGQPVDACKVMCSHIKLGPF